MPGSAGGSKEGRAVPRCPSAQGRSQYCAEARPARRRERPSCVSGHLRPAIYLILGWLSFLPRWPAVAAGKAECTVPGEPERPPLFPEGSAPPCAISSLRTLVQILRNVLEDPRSELFRSINAEGALVRSRISAHAGGTSRRGALSLTRPLTPFAHSLGCAAQSGVSEHRRLGAGHVDAAVLCQAGSPARAARRCVSPLWAALRAGAHAAFACAPIQMHRRSWSRGVSGEALRTRPRPAGPPSVLPLRPTMASSFSRLQHAANMVQRGSRIVSKVPPPPSPILLPHTSPLRAVSDLWEASFEFRMEGGADGMAFVVQNGSGSALGEGSSGLGYSGVRSSVVIELDTFCNGHALRDAPAGHVSIHHGGKKAATSSSHKDSLACVGPPRPAHPR